MRVLVLGLVGYLAAVLLVLNVLVYRYASRAAEIMRALHMQGRSRLLRAVIDGVFAVLTFPAIIALKVVLLMRGYRPGDWKT